MTLQEYYDTIKFFDIATEDNCVTIDGSELGLSDSIDPCLIFDHLGLEIPKSFEGFVHTFLGKLEATNLSMVKKAHPTENESPVGLVVTVKPDDYTNDAILGYLRALTDKLDKINFIKE